MPAIDRNHIPSRGRFARSAAGTRRGAVALRLALACLALAGPASQALAERADRNKPVNVEADAMRYDDLKQTNVFTGKVTLTKGTLVIRADRLVLRQDPDGQQYATAYGSPASFRQKREGVDQFIVGVGQQLEYDGKLETLKIRHRANLKRLEKDRVTDELHGNLIVYDARTESIDVQGGGPSAGTAENPGGRVRVVIQPKNAEPAPAPDPTPLAPAQVLQAPRR
ncbi:MAG: lipopolysaccharide transport periplasmic protein LptA [Burkholderiaceae bacterium]|nr:lipopolysaccharide transport periplasmic protein LptA [Burkholderiaceae bacterium]